MRRCQFCGKSSQKGNQISHSAIKTIKRTYPNLRVKRLEINGKKVRVKICAKCLKALGKSSKSASGGESGSISKL